MHSGAQQNFFWPFRWNFFMTSFSAFALQVKRSSTDEFVNSRDLFFFSCKRLAFDWNANDWNSSEIERFYWTRHRPISEKKKNRSRCLTKRKVFRGGATVGRWCGIDAKCPLNGSVPNWKNKPRSRRRTATTLKVDAADDQVECDWNGRCSELHWAAAGSAWKEIGKKKSKKSAEWMGH